VRYLALGDSYTIGTGASDDSHSWPSIIASRLGAELTNPAVNGFTTLDLIPHELPYLVRVKPDLVTILIGVNDLVQGRSPDAYRRSLATIYDEVAKVSERRAAAVSIPTWSYTPAAADFGGKDHVEKLTRIFNGIASSEARSRDFTWIDLGEASTSGIGTTGWIAPDGLHPGDAQYAAWAEAIWSAAKDSWTQDEGGALPPRSPGRSAAKPPGGG
jgi:lysophospholipase L1-like esterase